MLQSDDTRVMLDALRALGLSIRETAGGTILEIASGLTEPPARPLDVFVGNSGTTIRFLTAALSALGGDYRLHGVPRMHSRPIGDLLAAIRNLGADAHSESPVGCPPVVIRSSGWKGGRTAVAGNISSQFLSGLLMAAPLAHAPVTLAVEGELVSKPYVDMTCRVMQSFGVAVETDGTDQFRIDAPQRYAGINYEIEPDASAASYHFAAAAITGGAVTVEGLSQDALQGDVRFCEVLRAMGAHVEYASDRIRVTGRAARGVDVDMNPISDTVQTLAVVALFAEGPTRIRGVAHNRYKETDRIGDLARELRRLGAAVTEFEDGLEIQPPTSVQPATVETYDDHRMAMSFALAGLAADGIVIRDPACTAKTYPEFFADLQRLTGRAHRWT